MHEFYEALRTLSLSDPAFRVWHCCQDMIVNQVPCGCIPMDIMERFHGLFGYTKKQWFAILSELEDYGYISYDKDDDGVDICRFYSAGRG